MSSCHLRKGTPSLKLPWPQDWWSVTGPESDPWIRTSDNLKDLDADYMLIGVNFLSALWSHAETSNYHFSQRTPSLKLPPPLDWWSVTGAESEPWIRTSDNLKDLGADYMLVGVNFLSALWFHAETSNYHFSQRTPSLKLPPPLDWWSVTDPESEPWIKTSNNRKELGQIICWVESPFWCRADTSSCHLKERIPSLKHPIFLREP